MTAAFTVFSTADRNLTATKAAAPRAVRAKYDAAQTTRENRRHWANADNLSAIAAQNPAVRQTLRNRSRYEEINDGYYGGLIRDLAADVVGTGPGLESRLDADADNRLVEESWEEWCDAVFWSDRLRILEEGRVRDGEQMLLFATNPKLKPKTPVLFDPIPFECDQFGDPPGKARPWDPHADDGITTDALGYPETYTLLVRHPGDSRGLSALTEGKTIAAEQLVHWFRVCRPGQLRGITDLTTALPICPLIRRHAQASVSAAEVAARFAVLLESQLGTPDPDAEEADEDPEFQEFDLPHVGGMTLPRGYKAAQMKPEHPTTSFASFDDAMLRRAGRGTQMPFGGTVGDHSKYNYSSARLELWFRNRRRNVVREQLRMRVLDRVYEVWCREARLAGILSVNTKRPDRYPHIWRYESDPSLDPTKDAQADDSRLRNGTATFDEVWAGKGGEWKDRLKKQAEVIRYAEELGLKGIAEILRGNVPAGQPVTAITDPNEGAHKP